MRFSPREIGLALFTLAAILLGGTAIVLRPRLDEWRGMAAERADTEADIEDARVWVEQRPRWEQELGQLSQQLPSTEADRDMVVYWLTEMERVAAVNNLVISKRQTGDEEENRGIFELPIECEWEGTLDAITHFLFDLQAEGAKFDVRQLLVKPKKGTLLRGRFTLFCAFTREGTQSAEPETGEGT